MWRFFRPGTPSPMRPKNSIEELFGDSGEYSVVTLLFRGEAITPGGLAQMSALIDEIVSEPGVGEFLAPSNAIVAPSSLIGAVLQVEGFESITQAQIDSVGNVPEIQGAIERSPGPTRRALRSRSPTSA